MDEQLDNNAKGRVGFMAMKKKMLQQAREHLATYVDTIINAYHEGLCDGATAKLRLQTEIAATLQDMRPAAFKSCLWLRIQLAHTPRQLTRVMETIQRYAGDPLAMNYVGPRTDGGTPAGVPAVLYLTVTLPARQVNALIAELAAMECPVRDWRYGCVRRDAA